MANIHTIVQIINGRRVELDSLMTPEQRENAIRAALGAPPIPVPTQHPKLVNVQLGAGSDATAARIAENQARINAEHSRQVAIDHAEAIARHNAEAANWQSLTDDELKFFKES